MAFYSYPDSYVKKSQVFSEPSTITKYPRKSVNSGWSQSGYAIEQCLPENIKYVLAPKDVKNETF